MKKLIRQILLKILPGHFFKQRFNVGIIFIYFLQHTGSVQQ